MEKAELIKFFDAQSLTRDKWRIKNWYYHKELENFISFLTPENSSVLEIGCGTGDLLKNLRPKEGAGIDISPEMIKAASSKYPGLRFHADDLENLKFEKKFDYVVMQDLIGHLIDVWAAFRNLRKLTSPATRIIITYYNHIWEPVILLAEFLGLKEKQPYQNWLSLNDIENLLYLNNYEVIKKGSRFLFPLWMPVISNFINKYLAKLPVIRNLCLINFIVAKETAAKPEFKDYSVSIVVPCRNEEGNIEELVSRIPDLGMNTETIFVDGQSTDGTVRKIQESIEKLKHKNIKLVEQGVPRGKADAVRKGFEAAKNEMLIILDADITVAPEDLEKFYLAIAEGKGEFINGSRLVYPMEKGAMRTLNMFGNKVFSMIFTWTLGQRIKDTLCGTKALLTENYLKIKKGRVFFGDFDPFGDFDLLFGASKLNLKTVDMPVSYRERKHGETKISRWRHGFLLFKMSFMAFKKFKLQ